VFQQPIIPVISPMLQAQGASKESGEAQSHLYLGLERRCMEAEALTDSLRKQLETVSRDLEAAQARLQSELAHAKVCGGFISIPLEDHGANHWCPTVKALSYPPPVRANIEARSMLPDCPTSLRQRGPMLVIKKNLV